MSRKLCWMSLVGCVVAFVTVTGSQSQATASECKPCEEVICAPCDPCTPVCGKGRRSLLSSLSFYGWIEAGIQVNNHGTSNSYANAGKAPLSQMDAFSGNSYLLMTQQPTDFHVNQTWFGVAKRIDISREFDWGFQCDTFYGTDAKYGQAFSDRTFDYGWGTGDYYLSIPQIYAEIGGNGGKIRVGKFAPTMVQEALPAPYTFFYSHSYDCFATPLTYSGVVGEYNFGKKLTVSSGWTAGMHNSFVNRFGDNAFVGSVTLRPMPTMSLAYNLYYGYNKQGDPAYNRFYNSAHNTVHTCVFTWAFRPQWFYMIEGVFEDNAYVATAGNYTTRSAGCNQHLIYTINKKWSVGVRGEYHRAEGTMFDMQHLTGGQGTDLYQFTLAANWTPVSYFTLRPELRCDWANYDNGFKPFNNRTESSQVSFGCAGIVKF
ncbi:MAG: carbohydrate porin [Thermoguttaceae bacterium]